MTIRKLIALLISCALLFSSCAMAKQRKTVTLPTDIYAANSYDLTVEVDLAGEAKEISPYIYGINEYGNSDFADFTAIRQGGNRMTAYNWETNASNAGADWYHSSDNNLSSSDEPADCVMRLSKTAAENGISYKLATLQLAGYVAADKKGEVRERETAPSKRWNEVKLVKGSEFDKTPDLEDGVVYMDEYVNYIIKKLGDSTSKKGIQGYNLDNEPALWSGTHARVRPNPVGMQELTDMSAEIAYAVKQLDPNAEIFGPSLYGFTAYDHLADDDNSDEWETLKRENDYNWYIDFYLDSMRKASEEKGVRLLDVFDIHYYSESARVGEEDRVQSVRTLYEEGFYENSWIGQWCRDKLPILPTVKESIDKYYPGTKLAITEYNFGGEDISGTIAQAEALGCYADMGVYFATIWGGNPFQYAGIRLYTNYDGDGNSFGDKLIPASTEDIAKSAAYAALTEESSTLTVMLTNKDKENNENALIKLSNATVQYSAAAVYAVFGESSDIRLIDIIEFEGSELSVTLPPYCAAMVVVSENAEDFPIVAQD